MSRWIDHLKLRTRQFGWETLPERELVRSFLYYRRSYDRAKIDSRWPDGEFGQEMRWEQHVYPDYAHTEYLLRLDEPAVVEPSHGMVVVRGNRLIPYLMAIHEDVPVAPMYFAKYQASCRNALRLKSAILLRHHYGEDNYGHFFLDIIPKLLMAERLAERFPELRSIPFLIGKALAEKSYFKNLVNSSNLSIRRWIVQDDAAIQVDHLYCLKGTPYTLPWVKGIWRLFGLQGAQTEMNQRVYLRRNTTRRRLVNQDEVENYLKRRGFVTVDAARLSHVDQIKLFSNVRYLVAEHGSGVANILFRQGEPLSVLEMFPPEYVSPAYFACAHLLGASYERVRGIGIGDNTGSYRMPVDLLDAKLDAWFQTSRSNLRELACAGIMG